MQAKLMGERREREEEIFLHGAPSLLPPSLLFLPPDVYDVIILSYGARHHHRRISQPSNRGKEKGGREGEGNSVN